MKYLLITAIVLASSCREEEAYWNKLTPAEKAAVAQRAYASCQDDLGKKFKEFKAASGDVYTSDSWQRNDAWKHTFKSGSSEEITKVRVWKNDGTTIYLAVSKTVGSSTDQYFLRIPNNVNEDMIDDLNEQICRNFDITKYKEGNPLAVTRAYEKRSGGETHKYTDTYNFKFSHLAWVGSEWNVTRRILKTDSDGKKIDDKTWTSTFTVLTGEANLDPDPDEWSTEYCDVHKPTANAQYPDLNFVLPYLTGDDNVPSTKNCRNDGTVPPSWDLTI